MSENSYRAYSYVLPSGRMIQLQSEEDLFAIGQALSFKIDAEIDRELENGQWLRFAEAATTGIMSIPCEYSSEAEMEKGLARDVKTCADFADAMLAEAKLRGRL